jgi:hypothetical protein
MPASRRGRPPLPVEAVKHTPLNMRTTPAIRERLEQAARRSGNSLAQEVAVRLELSFLVDAEAKKGGADEPLRSLEDLSVHTLAVLANVIRMLEPHRPLEGELAPLAHAADLMRLLPLTPKPKTDSEASSPPATPQEE